MLRTKSRFSTRTGLLALAPAEYSLERVFSMSLVERVALVQEGVKAKEFKTLVTRMAIPQETLSRVLRIPVATVNRKARQDEKLSIDDSERVVNMAALIGQVNSMVSQSGAVDDFDAAKWVAAWIEQPLPALGGKRPADFLNTAGGFSVISDVLSAMEGGAYL